MSLPKSSKRIGGLILATTFLLPYLALAQIIATIPNAPKTNLLDTSPIIKIVIWMAGVFWVVAVAMVIWAAFLYLTAGGSEDKIKEGKQRLLYALIAGAIALLANGIYIIVENILKGTV